MAQLKLVSALGVLHHPTHILGRATELRATAELLERGFDIAVPAVDAGYDLLVDGRFTVQVKAANVRANGSAGAQQYTFSFGRSRRLRADFLLGRGPQHDIWWVIPAHVVPASASAVSVSPLAPNPNGRGRPHRVDYSVYQNAWDLLRG